MSKQRLCLEKDVKIMAWPTYFQTQWTKSREESQILKALNKSAVCITTASPKPLTIFSCSSPAALFTHLYHN